MSSSYYELQIKINPAIEEILSDFCFEILHCEGVILAEETYKDLEMVSTTEGTLKVFLLYEPEELDELLKYERNALKARGLSDKELGSWDYVISNKPNEDWAKKWKEKWDITRVTDKIVVVPDWLEYTPQKDEIIIKLEPGCAFGTGTHATTQLCMKAIEKHMPENATVADIGMGSGILAICAKKFGAAYVYGCDNDETVIEVAKENAIKNNTKCYFELNTANKIIEKFDFVCANILHNVLAEIMPDLKNIMKPQAKLVLSGILDEKRKVVLDAIKANKLKCIDETHQNQWVSFTVMIGEN